MLIDTKLKEESKDNFSNTKEDQEKFINDILNKPAQ